MLLNASYCAFLPLPYSKTYIFDERNMEGEVYDVSHAEKLDSSYVPDLV